MNAIDNFRMDKNTLSVIGLSDGSDEREYWQAKTPQERLEAVELMRLFALMFAMSGV
jgi:hypothetical protein